MKLLMEPGGALLMMALLAFIARWLIGKVGLGILGSLISWILLLAIIFGVAGGLYLLSVGRNKDS